MKLGSIVISVHSLDHVRDRTSAKSRSKLMVVPMSISGGGYFGALANGCVWLYTCCVCVIVYMYVRVCGDVRN